MSGFTLNIDDKLLEKLVLAEKRVLAIGTAAQKTKQQFEQAFGAMVNGNLEAFIKKLQDANSLLSGFSGKFGPSNSGITQIATESSKSVDMLNLLIEALTKLNNVKSQRTQTSDDSEAKKTKEKERNLRMYATMFEQVERKEAQATRKQEQEARKRERLLEQETRKREREAKKREKLLEQEARARERALRLEEQAERQRIKTSAELIGMNGKAKSLSELKTYAKELQRTMATLDPKSKEWAKLNTIYKQTNSKIKDIRKSMGEAHETSNKMLDALKKIFAFQSIKKFVNNLVTVRSEFEKQHRALEVLLQDTQKAQLLWDRVVQLAIKSPFRVKELVTYTKQLAAYRIESDKLYDTTKRLGDISIGLGVDMNRLILAYGQVRAANFLRGTELRQFTEAGVPMLEELAKHFSALEKTQVTAAQVFDRISKRQVLFQDVDAVIRKMTDAGGAFYQMQEQMSETLSGTIANLKDKYDLALNQIGKDNTSIIKGFLGTMGFLVEHFRVLSTLIPTIAVGFASWKISSLVLNMKAAMATSGGLAANFKKLGLSLLFMKKAGGSIALGVTSWLSIFTLVGVGIWQWNKNIDAGNEALDRMSKSNIRTMSSLVGLKQQIEQNNKVIGNASSSENDLAEARTSNYEALNKLKEQHPEYYRDIIQQKNGIVSATEALEKHIDSLRRLSSIQALAKGGFFRASLTTNYANLVKDFAKVESWVIEARGKLEAQLSELVQEGASEAEIDKLAKKIARLTGVIDEGIDLSKLEIAQATKEGRTIWKYDGVVDELAQELNDFRASILNVFGNLRDSIPLFATEVFGKDAVEGGQIIDRILGYLGIADGQFRKELGILINEQLKEQGYVDIDFDFDIKPAAQNWAAWQKNVNQKVEELLKETNKDLKEEDYVLAFPKVVTDTTTQDAYTKQLTDNLSDLKSTIKRVKKVFEQNQSLIGTAFEGMNLNQMEANISLYEKMIEFMGDPIETSSSAGAKDEKTLSRRISLLKEMNTQYEALRKKYPEGQVRDMILRDYAQTFEDAFGHSLKQANFDFATKGGLAKELKKLTPLAAKEGKEAGITLQRAISEATSEKNIAGKILGEEEFKNKAEELFQRYEETVALTNAGFSQTVAKSLFDIDYLDETQLETGLAALKAQYTDYGLDMQEIQDTFDKKLMDIQTKNLKERIKKYAKYLYAAQRESVKIRLEEAKALQAIDATIDDDTLKEQAKQRVREDTATKLQSTQWADFKGSEMYSMMFGDLEHYGTKTLEALKTQLEGLNRSLKDLPANEFKEIVKAIEQIDDITGKRNPFAAIVDSRTKITEIREELSSLNIAAPETDEDLALQIVQKQEMVDKTQQEVDLLNTALPLLQQGNQLTQDMASALKVQLGIEKANVQSISEAIDLKTKALTKDKAILEVLIKYSKALANLAKNQDNALTKTKNIISKVGEAVKSSMTLMEALGVSTDSIAYSMAEGIDGMISLTVSAIEFQLQMQAVGYASNLALGIIGWVAMGIQAIATLLSAIFKARDKALENQIQDLADDVEIAQEKFEALNNTIDRAYHSGQLEQAAKDAKAYAEEMIRNYERMIALEEQKKKTDDEKIKEYLENIDQAKEDLAEMEQKIVSEATASILDDTLEAARSFVDAWYDAFKETGDGLKGLEENFEDMFLNLAKQQAAQQIVGIYADQWSTNLQKYVNKDDTELTKDDAQKWAEEVKATFPALNDALEGFLGVLTNTSAATGSLTGLEEGIAGASEETVQVVAAYLNSIRFFVSDNNTVIKQLRDYVVGTDEAGNPMLGQLRVIAEQTKAIKSLLEDVKSGNKLRVILD